MTTAKSSRLGTFTFDQQRKLHGVIGALGIGAIHVESESATSLDGKPYLRLIADPQGLPYEVGAAFPKEKNGVPYYSVLLESPVLPTPINAALFPDRNNAQLLNLVWNRPEAQAPKAEATAQKAPPVPAPQKRIPFVPGKPF